MPSLLLYALDIGTKVPLFNNNYVFEAIIHVVYAKQSRMNIYMGRNVQGAPY